VYYRLSKVSKNKCLKKAFEKFLKNKNVNWKRGVICSAHWASGKRKFFEDLPNRSTTQLYLDKKTSYVTPPHKIASAKRCIEEESLPLNVRRKLGRNKVQVDEQIDCKDEVIESISKENSLLKSQIQERQDKLREKESEMSKMAAELTTLRNCKTHYERQLCLFKNEIEKKTFACENVVKRGQCLYMTGLTENEFDCMFECVEPFLGCIVYPDCKSNDPVTRKLDSRTELMCFLTISRHSLHLGIMGWMSNTSVATQSRLFVAWSVFLSTVQKQLTPLHFQVTYRLSCRSIFMMQVLVTRAV